MRGKLGILKLSKEALHLSMAWDREQTYDNRLRAVGCVSATFRYVAHLDLLRKHAKNREKLSRSCRATKGICLCDMVLNLVLAMRYAETPSGM